jgi:D-3-phosphoglycerate dehydrogenase
MGLGSIGSRVATIAKAFGMNVIATAWRGDDGRAAAIGARFVDLETLLRESDFASMHFRLSDETRGVLSRERLGLMKPSAFLINTARGALVDRDALLDALENGRIAGAGLDVFHEEPLPANDRIVTFPNVVLTPHNAGTTEEVIALGLSRTVENVERFVAHPS